MSDSASAVGRCISFVSSCTATAALAALLDPLPLGATEAAALRPDRLGDAALKNSATVLFPLSISRPCRRAVDAVGRDPSFAPRMLLHRVCQEDSSAGVLRTRPPGRPCTAQPASASRVPCMRRPPPRQPAQISLSRAYPSPRSRRSPVDAPATRIYPRSARLRLGVSSTSPTKHSPVAAVAAQGGTQSAALPEVVAKTESCLASSAAEPAVGSPTNCSPAEIRDCRCLEATATSRPSCALGRNAPRAPALALWPPVALVAAFASNFLED